MHHPSLETVIEILLSEQLRCEQEEELCLPILYQVARGKPVEQATLARSLQLTQHELEHQLSRLPDTEYDQHGKIVGWGVTQIPTRHRFQIDGKPLWTWCAFDTFLFAPYLQAEAQVQSTCPTSNQLVSFVISTDGEVAQLRPETAVISLILPTSRRDCTRDTFCEQSLFFSSEQAASPFLKGHLEAILLSVEEAAYVGKQVAQIRLQRTIDRASCAEGAANDAC